MASFQEGQESFLVLDTLLRKVGNAHETADDAMRAAQAIVGKTGVKKVYVAKVFFKVEVEKPTPPIVATPLKPKAPW